MGAIDITTKQLVVDVHIILRANQLGQLELDGTGLIYLNELLTLSIAGIELMYPLSFAQRWALVVFPIPGYPAMRTAGNTFIPCFPSFLKLNSPGRCNPSYLTAVAPTVCEAM